MNRATLGAIIGVLALVAAAVWSATQARRDLGSRNESEKPALALLTSLPLVFGENFGLEGGSPALARLEQRYLVQPIGVADAASLKGHRILLMAHPRAQPAEMLVELDRWVRDGGRVLLLADPKLDWPSERPFGDPLRPPPAFADTGLLAHWGLKLVGPEKLGPVHLGGGHNPIIYFSPGRFMSNNPDCELSRADIVAECRVGKGKVVIVADADFLNADAIQGYDGIPGNQTGELLELLETLETH